jgi:hypothetical protein
MLFIVPEQLVHFFKCPACCFWDEMGGPESRKKTKAGKESICSPLGLGEQAPGDQARKKIISVVVSKVTLWIG